jgi:hypothetical protein
MAGSYCPAGSIIVGVRGWVGQQFGELNWVCVQEPADGYDYPSPIVGGAAGSWYEFGCDWSNAEISTLSPALPGQETMWTASGLIVHV